MNTLVAWFAGQPWVRLAAGLALLAMMGLLTYRIGRGVGFRFLVLVSLALGFLFSISPALHLLAFPAILLLLALNEVRLRRAGQAYQPAQAFVERGGLRRGLIAAEAAVVLELPVEQVLAVALTSLLKRGLLEETATQPWTLAVAPGFQVRTRAADPRERAALRREAAQRLGVVLPGFEGPFLEQLEAAPGRPVPEAAWLVPLRLLIQGVAERLRGHELPATRRYYRQLVRRAYLDTEAALASPDGQRTLDHHLAWLLLEPQAGAWFQTIYPDYRPPWQRSEGQTQNVTGLRPEPGLPFPAWLAQAQSACTQALSAQPLRARTRAGEKITLGPGDPVSEAFLRAGTSPR